MSNDRTIYRRALQKWDDLHQAEQYSVPAGDGYTAILCSDYEMDKTLSSGREAELYRRDARDVAYSILDEGGKPHIVTSYTFDDIREMMDDRAVVSMITIGNGNLSEAFISGDNGRFDWKFVSQCSTHLKTGQFIMRHCGYATRHLSVPLGTFAMTEHSSVYGAYNQALPTIMSERDDDRIRQLHPHRRIGYRAIRNTFVDLFEPKPEDA